MKLFFFCLLLICGLCTRMVRARRRAHNTPAPPPRRACDSEDQTQLISSVLFHCACYSTNNGAQQPPKITILKHLWLSAGDFLFTEQEYIYRAFGLSRFLMPLNIGLHTSTLTRDLSYAATGPPGTGAGVGIGWLRGIQKID